jgi:hypothetical protein
MGYPKVEITQDFVAGVVESAVTEALGSPEDGELRIGIMSLLAESIWFTSGKPVVFLENSSLVQGLYDTSYRIDFDSFNLPINPVSFSFPENCIIDGFKLPPILLHQSDGLIISSVREDFGSCRTVVFNDQPTLDKALRSHESVKYQGEYAIAFTEEESKIHSILLKVCLGSVAYMLAFPDCIRKGLPSGMKDRDARIISNTVNKKNTSTLVLHKRFASSTSAHFRTGHFRTLRDERFKRNPDGSCRIVWVTDTYVSGKIEPYTLEKNNGTDETEQD